MKKATLQLVKQANKLLKKYADIDANEMKQEIADYIKQQVANASTSTETSGVMPFVSMLQEDRATLAINVVRDGNKIKVSYPAVAPSHLTDKYSPLSNQIRNYLQRNLELFGTVKNGEDIDYDDFTFTLNY
jgi:hypothetical protein